MRPGKRKALDKSQAADAMLDEAEKLKASVWAKVQHPFRVIKRQFGYLKVRYRGLKKIHSSWWCYLRCQTCGWCAPS